MLRVLFCSNQPTSQHACVCLLHSNYELKENSKIIALLNNFDDFISEESLWQLSETIKPRHSSKHLQHAT